MGAVTLAALPDSEGALMDFFRGLAVAALMFAVMVLALLAMCHG